MDRETRKDEEFAKKVLEEGLVTPEQLEDVKEAQAKMRELGIDKPLAEVMVDKKLISALHVRAIEKDSVIGAGHRVAGFELVRKLGQGAMGSVYLARQVTMDRMVALKVLPPRLAADSSYVDRFLREARASAKLSHVNVVQGIDAGEESGLYYFAMEYVEGRTCQKILDEDGPLPEKKALQIAKQVASALEHAHVHDLVHRDVKPENIMIDEVTGAAKLCDLGLAKSRGEGEATGGRGAVAVGTPHYISPEQARGGEDVDVRADIYSLGATLYTLLTGRTPFDGSPAVVLSRHLTDSCPAPRTLNRKLSAGFDAVIRKMMARHRAHRYFNPKELLGDLERLEAGKNPLALRFTGESTVAAARPPKKSARREKVPPQPKPLKNVLIPASVAAVMIALAVTAYVVTGGPQRPPRRPGPRRPRLPLLPTPRARTVRRSLPEGDLVLRDRYVRAAWLSPENPDKNYSGAKEARLRSSTPERYLVRFEFSEVPREPKVASALLVLPLKSCTGEGKAFVHRVLKDWAPETVTYKSPWKRPGMVNGEDYSKEPVAGLLPVGKETFEADLTLLVEEWLSGGKNLGVVVLAEPKKSLHCRFETPQAGPGRGPALAITFAPPEEKEEKPPEQLVLERARKLASKRKFAQALKVLDRIPKNLRNAVTESKIRFEREAVIAAALAEFDGLAKRAEKEDPEKARGILEKALSWKVAAVTRRAKEEMEKLEARKPKPRPAPPGPDPKEAARKKEEERKKALERARALISRENFGEAAKLLREKGLEGEELCVDAGLAAAALEQARNNLPELVGAEDFKLTRKGIKLTGRVAHASGKDIVLATPQAGEVTFSLDELSADDLLAVAAYRVIDPKKLRAAYLGCSVLALYGGNATRAWSILLKARKVVPSPEIDRLTKRADALLRGAREEKAGALVEELERAHAEKQWRTVLLRYRDLKSAFEEAKAFKSRASSIEKMAEEARAALAPKPKPARLEVDWSKYVTATLAGAGPRLALLRKENMLPEAMEVLEGLGSYREAYELGLKALKYPKDPYRGACENGYMDLICFRVLVAMKARKEADKHLKAVEEKAKDKKQGWLQEAAKDAPKWADKYPEKLKELAELEKKRLQFQNESSIQWDICDILGDQLRRLLRQRGELEFMLRKFAGNAEVRNGECNWRLLRCATLFGEHVAAVRFGSPLREKHPEHYGVKSGDCSWLVAEAKKELRDYRGALELYQEVLEKHPQHWSVTDQVVPVRIAECKRALGIR